MERFKQRWRRVPRRIRRPLVFFFGSLFILAAAATGWLPGPGGIPLFLIGIAILATEFERAAQFRDWILRLIQQCGAWFRTHKALAVMLCLCGLATALLVGFFIYNKLY